MSLEGYGKPWNHQAGQNTADNIFVFCDMQHSNLQNTLASRMLNMINVGEVRAFTVI
jgi:hypothetical protein